MLPTNIPGPILSMHGHARTHARKHKRNAWEGQIYPDQLLFSQTSCECNVYNI
jgi:hypothetical protein